MTDSGGEGRIGPYELRSLLGRGGMGEVWRAFDSRRGRDVALKLMTGSVGADPIFRDRFAREARLTARLSSAHVVPIHDFGEVDGRLFLDMRLVPGPTLREVIDEHPAGMGTARAIAITGQVATALDAAHSAGMVHRDVKPSNVLTEPGRHGEWCYLADFGIAKLLGETGAGRLTVTGAMPGTPAYMAPELWSDSASGGTSDVYALACVFVEMLTGRPPFRTADVASAIVHHLYEPPRLPSAHAPELARFDGPVATALAKDPSLRFAGAGAFADAVTSAWRQPSPPDHVTQPSYPHAGDVRPATPLRRGRRTALAIGAAVAVLVAVTATAVVATRDDGPPVSPPAPAAPTLEEVALALRDPGGIDLDADGRRAHVTGTDGSGRRVLSTLDVGTGAIESSVPVDPASREVAVTPDGTRAVVAAEYVAASDDRVTPGRTVDVVDLVRGVVVARVPVGLRPVQVAITPDGRTTFVANAGAADDATGSVTVVDTARAAPVATVPVGRAPQAVAIRPDGAAVYVADDGDGRGPGTVTRIDVVTRQPGVRLPGGPNPSAITVSPDGDRFWVANRDTDTRTGDVTAVGLTAGTSVPLGVAATRPFRVAATADGRRLVVLGSAQSVLQSDTVTTVDVNGDRMTGGPRTELRPISADLEADIAFASDLAVGRDSTVAYVVGSVVNGPGTLWRVRLG